MCYRAWVLKLWHADRYWYANHCLLVRDSINSSNVRRINIFKNTYIISQKYFLTRSTAGNTACCLPVFKISAFVFKQTILAVHRNCQIHVMASGRKSLRTPGTENGLRAQTKLLPLYACARWLFFSLAN